MTTLGQIVDNLGAELGDGWDESFLPAGCVVLLAAIDADGDPVLVARFSERLSWLERVGMIAYANALELSDFDNGDDE